MKFIFKYKYLLIFSIVLIIIWLVTVVDNKPKINDRDLQALSLGIYGVYKPESLQEIKGAGFKSVFYHTFYKDSDADVLRFLNTADRLNMKVVLNGMGFWQKYGYSIGYHNFDFARAEKKLKKFGSHHAVIGIYPYDEPSGTSEESITLLPKLQRVYSFIKKTEPQIVVLTAEDNGEKFLKYYAPYVDTYLDFVLFDFYPYRDNIEGNYKYNQRFGYNTVNSTDYRLSLISKSLKGKILWGGVIQAHDNPSIASFPPKDNFYNQAYLYQSYGANSLWYFAYTWGKQPKEKSPISRLEGWKWIKDINKKFEKKVVINHYFAPIKKNLIRNGNFRDNKYWNSIGRWGKIKINKGELILRGQGIGQQVEVWQDVNVVAGRKYGITGQFKSESVFQKDGVVAKIEYLNFAGERFGEDIMIAGWLKSPNYVWQRREFIPPVGTKKVRLTLYYNDVDKKFRQVYFRNLTLGLLKE